MVETKRNDPLMMIRNLEMKRRNTKRIKRRRRTRRRKRKTKNRDICRSVFVSVRFDCHETMRRLARLSTRLFKKKCYIKIGKLGKKESVSIWFEPVPSSLAGKVLSPDNLETFDTNLSKRGVGLPKPVIVLVPLKNRSRVSCKRRHSKLWK
jgi:hypothetical protein